MAWLLDMHPLMGLLGGTITLVGGHGTGAAYATRFADFNNIQDVMALAMTSATLGLVLGGVVGGPVAEWLMRRHKLAGSLDQATASHDAPDLSEDQAPSTSGSFIVSLTAAFICWRWAAISPRWSRMPRSACPTSCGAWPPACSSATAARAWA